MREKETNRSSKKGTLLRAEGALLRILVLALTLFVVMQTTALPLFATPGVETNPEEAVNAVSELSGEGTLESPYLISNKADLQLMGELVNGTGGTSATAYRGAHYRLTANIDMSGESWTPMGVTSAAAFTGSVDGNGKAIQNLTVEASGQAGLFGYISNAKVFDLTLENCDIKSTGNHTGAIASYSGSATIENCVVTGSVSGGTYVGGIIGRSLLYSGQQLLIQQCVVEANIKGGNNVGGIAGYLESGTTGRATITECYFNGNVTATSSSYAGGIVGGGTALNIENCRSDGSVTGLSGVGGIIGTVINSYYETSFITNCYSTAKIHGTARVGGIFGYSGNANATSKLTVTGCRALNESVTVAEWSNGANQVGAVHGGYGYEAGFAITDYNAWKGMLIGETGQVAVLGAIGRGDDYFNESFNGKHTLSYRLETAGGWPSGFSEESGKWVFEAGKLPVLNALPGKMSAVYPEYISAYLGELTTADRTPASDRTALEQMITAAKEMTQAEYADGWSAFQVALADAETVVGDTEATQVKIDTASTVFQGVVDTMISRKALTWAGGTGTAEDPWQIDSAGLLTKMNRLFQDDPTSLNKSFLLTADIDMTGELWSSNVNTTARIYTGSFNGNGKTISNLTVTGTGYTGLFGYVGAGGKISNLTLSDCDILTVNVGISTNNYTGAIAGYVNGAGATINNCHVTGTVVNEYNITGGIVGGVSGAGASILNCTFSGIVTSPGHTLGGIAGSLGGAGARIDNCVTNGASINDGRMYIGGIVGSISGNGVSVHNSYAKADMSGDTSIGGIVGSAATNSTVSIDGCYYVGKITGVLGSSESYAGGILGASLASTTGEIRNCRSDGTISPALNAGGILGAYAGATANSNFLITACYTTMAIGNTDNGGGLVGTNRTVVPGGVLSISDSIALNSSVGGYAAGAIHAFGDTSKIAVLGGVRAWDGMLVNGKVSENAENNVSYAALLTKAAWPVAFSGEAWELVDGSMPVLTALNKVMNGVFPVYMQDAESLAAVTDILSLNEAIAAASNLDNSDYTPESWAAVEAALSAARVVFKAALAGSVEQAAVNTAVANLQGAMETLVVAEPTSLKGSGSAGDPYQVGTAAELEEMRRLIAGSRAYRSASYQLTADVDLGDNEWVPFELFSGDFDGNGKALTNLNINVTTSMVGFFKEIEGGSVRNLTIANSEIAAASYIGVIAGSITNTTIENCTVKGNIIGVVGGVTGSSTIGGIVGTATRESSIINCHFDGHILVGSARSTAAGRYVAGIVGLLTTNGLVEDCTVNGKIEVYANQSEVGNGGIVGTAMIGSTIRNCHVTADISVAGSGNNVGGIIGTIVSETSGGDAVNSHFILDSSFKGTITTAGANTGGIAGSVGSGMTIVNCSSAGIISTRASSGGIVGRVTLASNQHSVVRDCVTTMDITGTTDAGGIAGTLYLPTGSGNLVLENSLALNGSLRGTANRVYAMVANTTAKVVYNNSYALEDMLINGTSLRELFEQGRITYLTGDRILSQEELDILLDKAPSILLDFSQTVILEGDYLSIDVSLSREIQSNVIVLDYLFDNELVEFASYTTPDGAALIGEAETTDYGVRIILMVQDYEMKNLGTIMLRAKETVTEPVELMRVVGQLVNKHGDEQTDKRVLSVSSDPLNIDPKDPIVAIDLIYLSNVIDAFGTTSSDAAWPEVKKYDWNNSGTIDITDIVYAAQRVVL